MTDPLRAKGNGGYVMSKDENNWPRFCFKASSSLTASLESVQWNTHSLYNVCSNDCEEVRRHNKPVRTKKPKPMFKFGQNLNSEILN